MKISLATPDGKGLPLGDTDFVTTRPPSFGQFMKSTLKRGKHTHEWLATASGLSGPIVEKILDDEIVITRAITMNLSMALSVDRKKKVIKSLAGTIYRLSQQRPFFDAHGYTKHASWRTKAYIKAERYLENAKAADRSFYKQQGYIRNLGLRRIARASAKRIMAVTRPASFKGWLDNQCSANGSCDLT